MRTLRQPLAALLIPLALLSGCGNRDALFRDPMANVELDNARRVRRSTIDARGGGCQSPLPARITEVFAPTPTSSTIRVRDELVRLAVLHGWTIEGAPPGEVILGEKPIDDELAELSISDQHGEVVLILQR